MIGLVPLSLLHVVDFTAPILVWFMHNYLSIPVA
jgi:hypothetical protein